MLIVEAQFSYRMLSLLSTCVSLLYSLAIQFMGKIHPKGKVDL